MATIGAFKYDRMPSYHYFGNEDDRIPQDIVEMVIQSLVPYIPEEACCNYEHLISAIVNRSALKMIETHAFHGCQALTDIEIPLSATVIESYRRLSLMPNLKKKSVS